MTKRKTKRKIVASTLTFDAPPSTEAVLTPFTLKCLLKHSTTPTVGRAVYLTLKPHAASQYTDFGQASTDANGDAWFSNIRVPTSGIWNFVAMFDGDDAYDGIVSSPLTITITDSRTSPTLTVTADTAWASEAFAIYVDSTPPPHIPPLVGGQLTDGSVITLQRSVDGGSTWAPIMTALLAGGVCSFTLTEDAALASKTVKYRAVFGGDDSYTGVTSSVITVTIQPSVDMHLNAEVSTKAPATGIEYTVDCEVSYIDNGDTILLANALVEIYSYAMFSNDQQIRGQPPYALVDIVYTDNVGRASRGFIENSQLRRYVRVVVPSQTIDGVRYNGCVTSPDLAFTVYNILALGGTLLQADGGNL